MTNSAKKMTKMEKETIYQIMAEQVCRKYGFSDEFEPTVTVQGLVALGQYSKLNCHTWIGSGYNTVAHHIIIRPSQGLDTLAHELAHFVQTMKEGDSRCHEMNAAHCRGEQLPELCIRHAALTTEIRKMIDCNMES